MFEKKVYVGDKIIDNDRMMKTGVNLEDNYVVVSFFYIVWVS